MINNFLAHAAVLIIALPLLAHVVLRERPPKEASRAPGNAPAAGPGRTASAKGSPSAAKTTAGPKSGSKAGAKAAKGAKARRSSSDGSGTTRVLGSTPDATDSAKKGRPGTPKRAR
ncbi:hypothetical protein [Lolliginicoccus suaedae]|uniref:hypothetical protein n=1 Tax=Lolliginicoccus suaedae TaxID=2605429 RepID=UPI0011EBF4E1|nr:hypothetical protein [Lolliginicoccus suaedae]